MRARLARGERDRVAEAAGHLGPWLSGWLKGRQDATLDEIAIVARAVGTTLAKIIDAPDASPIDWEVFGLMARVHDDRKLLARHLVKGLVEAEAEADDESESTPPPRARQRATTRGRPSQ